MDYQLTFPGDQIESDCLVTVIFKNQALPAQLQGDSFDAELGTSRLLPPVDNQAPRTLVMGGGEAENLNAENFRRLAQAAAKQIIDYNFKSIHWTVSQSDAQLQESIIQLTNASYVFDQFKSESKPCKLETVYISGDKATLNQAIALTRGMTLAKDLANSPANACTPSYMADIAKQVSKQTKGLTCNVIDEHQIIKMGMGSFASVAQGSEQPAKLITLEYHGHPDKNAKPYVFIGKGVTFDSGGISLKPGRGMDEMKYDMCGAASVMGLMQAVAELELPLNIIGLMACTENMPSGKATKPGDIFTTLSGQTVEVLNTDAEGRLILCDVLTYAEKYEPEAVIDIATLTGAVIVCLGHLKTGLMSNNDWLAEALQRAGDESLDTAWRLPINEDYDKGLESPFADMANISGPSFGAGTITAACFLSRFAKKYHWAHLDIAGTAWDSGATKAATARPIPLMLQFLLNQCA